MDVWTLLFDMALLLTGALLAGGLCSRLGQSPIVGYLFAGMILGGPGSVDLLDLQDDIAAIAELGVSLLMFSIGLEFSWRRLVRLGGRTLLAGVLQVVVTAIVIAAVAGFFLPTAESVAVGAMLALSSTACVLRMLNERAELDSPHGRGSLAILLVQDMAVIPLALLMSALGSSGTTGEILAEAGRMLLVAAGLIVGLYVLLNQVAARLLSALGHARDRELVIILGMLTGVGAAWVSHHFGISPSIGAFVAGLALAGSPFATQVRADVASVRVVLLTLFFGTAGMVANPVWIVQHLWLVLPVTLAIMVIKTGIIWAIFRVLRRSHAGAIATGLCLAQIGEFAFVLGYIGTGGGVVSADTFTLIVSCALLTLLATPFLVPVAPHVGHWVQRRLGVPVDDRAGHEGEHVPAEIVIVGFGPAGQQVADSLRAVGRRALVLELNSSAATAVHDMGLRFEIGDATHPDIVQHVASPTLRLVVITIPSPTAALQVLRQVRRIAPEAHTIVRSRYELHRSDFEDAGAHEVIVDESEVGDALARAVRAHGDPVPVALKPGTP
ncbi:MAG: cation:proton antiporter [Phycisphaerales bacterium]|nr:cation:proton antiporter [Phycisphaerales bacterium]